MPDVFMYANETANLDYQEHQGASSRWLPRRRWQ